MRGPRNTRTLNPRRLSNYQSNWLIYRPIKIIELNHFLELTLFCSFEFIFPSLDCSESRWTRSLFFTGNTAMIVQANVIFITRVHRKLISDESYLGKFKVKVWNLRLHSLISVQVFPMSMKPSGQTHVNDSPLFSGMHCHWHILPFVIHILKKHGWKSTMVINSNALEHHFSKRLNCRHIHKNYFEKISGS